MITLKRKKTRKYNLILQIREGNGHPPVFLYTAKISLRCSYCECTIGVVN